MVAVVGLAHSAAQGQRGASAPAPLRSYTQRVPGSDVSFEMVPVRGGVFTMGSLGKDAKPDETPPVEVEVEPFYMGKYEVTWAEYEPFLQNYHRLAQTRADQRPPVPADRVADAVTYPTPMYELEAGPLLDRMGRGEGFPAVGMSHFAARQYTKWLSKKTGRFYRLPTEAEWEYACRAGTTTAYNTGADEAALKDAGWFFDNSEKEDGDGAYRAVGQKKPNAWGLYDMHGNVAEWTLDAYDAEWYGKFAGRKVKALEFVNWPAERYGRVIRGGGWESEADDCRSAARTRSTPAMNAIDPERPKSAFWEANTFWVGFRVVCPAREPGGAEKRRYWNTDDPLTERGIQRNREMRELVEPMPAGESESTKEPTVVPPAKAD